jgi:hypothetical protein
MIENIKPLISVVSVEKNKPTMYKWEKQTRTIPRVLNEYNVVKFGKYNGYKYEEVAQWDHDYVGWIMECDLNYKSRSGEIHYMEYIQVFRAWLKRQVKWTPKKVLPYKQDIDFRKKIGKLYHSGYFKGTYLSKIPVELFDKIMEEYLNYCVKKVENFYCECNDDVDDSYWCGIHYKHYGTPRYDYDDSYNSDDDDYDYC